MEEIRVRKNERSLNIICGTFFEILKEKPFEEISITELCARAELARKTFYRNFKSKEDIVKISIDKKMKEFHEGIDFESVISKNEISSEYFEFWYRHKEFLTIIFKNNLFNIVNSQYDLYMKEFRKSLKGEEEESKTLEYMILFISGGFWNILQNWVRNGFLENPKEMGEISNKIMKEFCIKEKR